MMTERKKRESCPCGSGANLEGCCGPIISGRRAAKTAEELMRSRYTAYVLEKVDYLVQTTHFQERTLELAADIRAWMDEVSWLRLHVLSTESGGADDRSGWVEFIAEFVTQAGPSQHHERSLFRKSKGRWYYVTAE